VETYPTPGRRTLVSTEGGVSPVWGQDGRQLYYWQQDRLIAAQLDARGGGPVTVRDRTPLFHVPYYVGAHAMYDVSPDGSRFVIVTSGAPPGPLVVALNALGPAADRSAAR
jgi:Tol biopolymer transport system component